VVVILAALASTATASGAGWPGFRGPLRDGVSGETGLVEAWPAAGPEVLWRVGAGSGYSAVSVVEDRAFTLWQEDGEQKLVALDVVDGSLLWSRAVGPAFASSYGDGPRSTPVIDEGRVFAISAHGRLVAVAASDGEELWSHELGAQFGARIPSIGYASTPLVEGDRLLVEVGSATGAFMAFDKGSGEVIWSSLSDEPAYASPIALSFQGRRQVVFFSASGLHALAPKDGRLLWHHPWAAPCPATGIPLAAASPVFVAPDRIFVSSAWGEHKGGGVVEIVERGGELAAERLWHAKLIDGEISTAVLVGGHLYGFKGSILVSVDAATGEMGWSARGFGRGSLIAAEGKLIVLAEDGTLALVEASPDEYRLLARAPILSGRSWTAPSLADGRLFLRNGEEVVSLDLRDHVEESGRMPEATPAPSR
jgi:outer membrane protein assembly factor BamB